MNSTKAPPVSPVLVIIIGIAAVSTASIFVRFAQTEASSLVIAAMRLTIASVILVPVAATRHKRELSSLKGRGLVLALISGGFLALHFATWISSLNYTTVASSAVLVATIPLWVALLSPFTIKEPIKRLVWIGLAFTLLGVVIVAVSDTCTFTGSSISCPSVTSLVQGRAFVGDLLALAGAIFGAGYILIGRTLRAQMSLVGYISLVYGMAAIVLIIIMLAAGESPLGYSPEIYLWMVLLAVIPQLIGHSSFNWALGYLSAAYVSITLLGEPIGSTILAYIILNETPSLLKLAGGAFILLGIYIASRTEVGPTMELPE